MPELPEVETIVRSLQPRIFEKKISALTIFLPKIIHTQHDPNRLIGKSLNAVSRQGKNIIFDLSQGWHLRIHLKMTGQLLLNQPTDEFQKHTHVVFTLNKGELELRYRDIRQFGYIQVLDPLEWNQWLKTCSLGPDPLEITLPLFLKNLFTKRGTIKSVLLDQSVLGGLGNIYVDEILHQSQIHPQAHCHLLSKEQINTLYGRMQQILKEAIQLKGSSVRTYIEASGQKGQYQMKHQVYGRNGLPCLHCGTPIRKILVAGRGTCFCPHCQPG